MKRLAALFLVLTLAFSLSVPAAAAETASGTTLRLEETSGTVTVKTSGGQEKSVVDGMRLYNGYTVSTGAGSSAYVSLDDAKAVKLGANSRIELKKSGKKLEVSLLAGELLCNVTQPLKTEETLNIRSATFVTGIRGTVVGVSTRGVQEYDGTTRTTVFPRNADLPPIDVPLTPGQKLDVESILNTVQQAIDENRAPEEIQQRLEEAAQPELLTQDDITAMVAEEFANDAELAERVANALEEAGSDVSVDEAVESLPDLQAAEAAAEQAAQEQADEQMAAQEETIAANDAADEAAGVANDVAFDTTDGGASDSPSYADNNYGGNSSDDSSSDFGIGGGSPARKAYAATEAPASADEVAALFAEYDDVTVPALGDPATPFDGLAIPAGKTLTVTGGSLVRGLTNRGALTIASEGHLALYGDTAVAGNTNAGTITINGGLANYGRLVSSGTIVNNGWLDNGSMNDSVTITLYNTGSGRIVSSSGAQFTNFATFENEGAVSNAGYFKNYYSIMNAGTFTNQSGGEFHNGNTLSSASTTNNGTFTNQANATFWNWNVFTNKSSGKFVNAGTIGANSQPIVNEGGTVSGLSTGQVVEQGASYTVKAPFSFAGHFSINPSGVADDQISSDEAAGLIYYTIPATSPFAFTVTAETGYAFDIYALKDSIGGVTGASGMSTATVAKEASSGMAYYDRFTVELTTQGSEIDLSNMTISPIYTIITNDNYTDTYASTDHVAILENRTADEGYGYTGAGTILIGQGAKLTIGMGWGYSAAIINEGTLSIEATNSFSVSSTLTNHGTINVLGLDVESAGTAGGSLAVDSGGKVVNEGHIYVKAGAYRGGSLSVQSGGELVNSGTIVLETQSSGALGALDNLGTAVNNGSIVINGELCNGNELTNTKTITVNSGGCLCNYLGTAPGTLVNSGTIGGEGLLENSYSNPDAPTADPVTGTITNNGTIEATTLTIVGWTSGGSGSPGYVFVTSYNEAANKYVCIPAFGDPTSGSYSVVEYELTAASAVPNATSGMNTWYACTLGEDGKLTIPADQSGISNGGSPITEYVSITSSTVAGSAENTVYYVLSGGDYTVYDGDGLNEAELEIDGSDVGSCSVFGLDVGGNDEFKYTVLVLNPAV